VEEDLLRRAADLAERCERTATVTSTAFLTPAEQYALTNWARHRDCTLMLHGGGENCERRAAFFLPFYLTAEDFDPAEHLRAVHFSAPFGAPGHRDYLGAILGLGIRREWVGDILVQAHGAYVFCLPSVAPALLELEQVGRTGVLTPKAVIEPVRLAGTTVTNATLHNQDFIDNLDLRIGDTVLVQKAGEIIPEILSVVRSKRPEGTVPFHMPDTCPECGAPVVRDPDGAALRCTGAECPAQRLRNIAHFASREAMDIDGLGISLCQSLIEAGLVHSPAELYALEPQSVAALDHMGKKSAENLMAAIEKSKDAGMARLLCAFGIRQVGQKAAKVLAMHFGTLDKLMAATEEELMAIPDVGPTTAAYLRAWFDNTQSQHQIRLLRDAGVSFDSKEQVVDRRFAGKTFVLTGALEHFSRDEASAIIERFGGKTSSSVSKKTSYLLAGENTGSKYQKALTLGTPIITETEFLDMIRE